MFPSSTDPGKATAKFDAEDSLESSLARELRQQSAQPNHLKAGQVLAERYRILRHLGSGGMGDVYEAEHIFAPALRYAIKILRPNLVKETSAQVIQEASNVAKIRSRYVVRVTDVGKPSDDVAFLVMEYVGQDLGAYARAAGGVLPPPQVVNFCAQVCDALSAAHGQRLVHRDIKPSNCLVHSNDGNDYIVVSDFGLARVLHGEDSTYSEWTMAGSKGYIAPEVLSGQARPDQRVDIYSVGAMACCLITGAPPPLNIFSLDRDSAREYLRPVPRALLPILKKALALEPKHRYPSAGEMASELRQALPLLAWEQSSRPAVAPFSRRAMMVGLVGAVGLIALLTFAVQFANYLEGPSMQAFKTPQAEIERIVMLRPAVNEPSAGAPIPPDIGATAPAPMVVVASPSRKNTSKKSPSQERKPSTVLVDPPVDEGPEKILDALCRQIGKDCSAHSDWKRYAPQFATPGSLMATLTFRLQSEKGTAIITNWGSLSDDPGFQGCARRVNDAAMEERPIKRGIGNRTCNIAM